MWWTTVIFIGILMEIMIAVWVSYDFQWFYHGGFLGFFHPNFHTPVGQFLKTRTPSYIGSQVDTYLKPILTVIYRFKCTWKQLEYISMSVLTKVLIPIKALKPVFTIFFFSINWNDLLGFVKGLRLYNIKSYK